MTNDHRSPCPAWLFWLGLGVFACALFFKWQKWPAGTALLIASGLLTLAGAFIFRWRHGAGQTTGATCLAVAMLVMYTVFRLMYWPGAVFVGCAAITSIVGAAVLWWKSDRSPAGVLVALCLVLAGTAGLMSVPVHVVYHYMFFETPGAERFMHSGTGHWYRYSWFLYQDGQYARSAAMLDSAMAEVDFHHARTGKDGEWLKSQLRDIHAKVEAREWETFRLLRSPFEQER